MTLKERILTWWFAISSFALAIFYFLYARRGRELNEAHADAQRALLGQQLADIQERSRRSQKDYDVAKKDYESLRARHGDLLTRLGISVTGGIAPTGDPSQRDH